MPQPPDVGDIYIHYMTVHYHYRYHYHYITIHCIALHYIHIHIHIYIYTYDIYPNDTPMIPHAFLVSRRHSGIDPMIQVTLGKPCVILL